MKRFYSLLSNSGTPQQDENSLAPSIRRIIPFGLGVLLLILSCVTSCIFEGLGIVFFFSCLILSIVANSKPTIFHTMPVNYKKRTLYYFVDIIITTILAILFIIAVVAIIAIIDVIVLAITTPAVDEGVEEEAAVAISTSAILYSLFKTLFFCGSVSGISRIKNNKHFMITMIAFVLIYAVGGTLMAVLISGDSLFSGPLWFYENYEKLPLPWLSTTICAVLAVAAWVGSVMYVLKVEKPKAF